MAKSIFEEVDGTYEIQGDYLIPRLALLAEEMYLSGYGDSDIHAI